MEPGGGGMVKGRRREGGWNQVELAGEGGGSHSGLAGVSMGLALAGARAPAPRSRTSPSRPGGIGRPQTHWLYSCTLCSREQGTFSRHMTHLHPGVCYIKYFILDVFGVCAFLCL